MIEQRRSSILPQMRKNKIIGFSAIAVLVSVPLIISGCSSIGKTTGSENPTSTSTTVTSTISRPKPVIKSVDATTSGMENNYYAILEITLKNEGSDGTVIVHATLTQGSQTQTNDMITNINKNTTQVVRLTFPLKWKGGEWTQTVEAISP